MNLLFSSSDPVILSYKSVITKSEAVIIVCGSVISRYDFDITDCNSFFYLFFSSYLSVINVYKLL